MRVAVGSDHRGFTVRAQIAQVLQDLGHILCFFGSPRGETEDYPDIALQAARMVSLGEAERCVLLAASGMGMCIAANKLPRVRAAVCLDEWMAGVSRRSFDANVLCLSAEMLGDGQIPRILRAWMTADFEAGRHMRRIEKILAMEREPISPVGLQK